MTVEQKARELLASSLEGYARAYDKLHCDVADDFRRAAEIVRKSTLPDEERIRREALSDIEAERRRQIEAEGWTPEHDDTHSRGEMADAAACYAHGELIHDEADGALWPWDEDWWKPKDRRRDLVRAGALIVAEIERIDRTSSPTGGEDE